MLNVVRQTSKKVTDPVRQDYILYSNLIRMLSEKSGRKMHKRAERFFKQGLDACPHSFSGEDIRQRPPCFGGGRQWSPG